MTVRAPVNRRKLLVDRVHGVSSRLRWIILSRLAGGIDATGFPSVGRGFQLTTRNGHIKIGRGLLVSRDVYLFSSGQLRIGNDVYLGRNSIVSCFESVIIGNNVRIAERVSIHDENHVYEPAPVAPDERNSYSTSPITISDGVWIGANVTIVSGVTIGANTIVGAGSVVTTSLPENVIAAGVPARIIRRLEEADH